MCSEGDCTWSVCVYVCVCVCVCLSVCLSVCYLSPQGGQRAIPSGLSATLAWILKRWLPFKNTAFKSHGMKQKWKSQYANGLSSPPIGFRALSRLTKHGNYLMDNWWIEHCLRGRLQWKTVSKRQENQQRWTVAHMCSLVLRVLHCRAFSNSEDSGPLALHWCDELGLV